MLTAGSLPHRGVAHTEGVRLCKPPGQFLSFSVIFLFPPAIFLLFAVPFRAKSVRARFAPIESAKICMRGLADTRHGPGRGGGGGCGWSGAPRWSSNRISRSVSLRRKRKRMQSTGSTGTCRRKSASQADARLHVLRRRALAACRRSSCRKVEVPTATWLRRQGRTLAGNCGSHLLPCTKREEPLPAH